MTEHWNKTHYENFPDVVEAPPPSKAKRIAVTAVAWLIVSPAIPLAILHDLADQLSEMEPPRWGTWLCERAESFAMRHGVEWP